MTKKLTIEITEDAQGAGTLTTTMPDGTQLSKALYRAGYQAHQEQKLAQFEQAEVEDTIKGNVNYFSTELAKLIVKSDVVGTLAAAGKFQPATPLLDDEDDTPEDDEDEDLDDNDGDDD